MSVPNLHAQAIPDHVTPRYAVKLSVPAVVAMMHKEDQNPAMLELDAVCHALVEGLQTLGKPGVFISELRCKGVFGFFSTKRRLRRYDAEQDRDAYNRPAPIAYVADQAVGVWFPYDKNKKSMRFDMSYVTWLLTGCLPQRAFNDGEWTPMQKGGRRLICRMLEDHGILSKCGQYRETVGRVLTSTMLAPDDCAALMEIK